MVHQWLHSGISLHTMLSRMLVHCMWTFCHAWPLFKSTLWLSPRCPGWTRNSCSNCPAPSLWGVTVIVNKAELVTLPLSRSKEALAQSCWLPGSHICLHVCNDHSASTRNDDTTLFLAKMRQTENIVKLFLTFCDSISIKKPPNTLEVADFVLTQQLCAPPFYRRSVPAGHIRWAAERGRATMAPTEVVSIQPGCLGCQDQYS